MKMYLSAVLLLVGSLSAFGQKADHTQYQLPDGKIVTHQQLDSVNKAWGSKGYLMNHNDKNPNLVVITPMTDDFLKKMADEEANLNALLNKPAPDFALTDLSGKKWTLAALKGKVVVLNFWFTTCPGCIQEMPELNELKESYNKSTVVFLAMALDKAPLIRRFLKSHPFNYTLIPDAHAVSDKYHVSSYPTSIVIDPQGIIRFQQVGGKDIKQQVTAAINQVSNK